MKVFKVFTSQYRYIALVTLFYTLAFNSVLFTKFYSIFKNDPHILGLLVSFTVLVWAIQTLLFALLASRHTVKPLLISGLIIGTTSVYFANHYGIVIDATMLQNSIETQPEEVFGLLSFSLVIYLLFGAILPTVWILKAKISNETFLKESISKISTLGLSSFFILISVVPFSSQYASFFREYKSVRYYATPVTPIYSIIQFSQEKMLPDFNGPIQIASTLVDDKIVSDPDEKEHELIILIVGETARADHFSLNGYSRKTNPNLEQEAHLVSFSQVSSCGTSTSVSVPCMFSMNTRDNYTDGDIYRYYNALDILSRNGVAVLWRDNNSSSKGVADRVAYQSFRDPEINKVCDVECRDEGMLLGLEEFIAENHDRDILIVLHAMGSHGPEYYKRYPASFKQFTPTCDSNQLSTCEQSSLVNTYDNTILYADFVMSKTIALLKRYPEYETAMFYISDHGESLGENNIYLHGMPYSFAPENQIHVPLIAWLPPNSDYDYVATKERQNLPFSHDDLFCTMLSALEVTTTHCNEANSMLVREPEEHG